uniref:Uncharacterized protein n=1 Tax=Anguilla anguilla TaxID=7936 RepID=A0A0E9VTA9_ANGAN
MHDFEPIVLLIAANERLPLLPIRLYSYRLPRAIFYRIKFFLNNREPRHWYFLS